MSERLQTLLQYLLPKQPVTTLAGHIARARAGLVTTRLIRWFIKRYGVDMTDAATADIASYKSFNDFFTRQLKIGVRPLARADFICPVDGAISQFGDIDDHHILQAKGHRFTVTDLVGGDGELAAKFHHGGFANLYLSPRDYHRLHMPCDGILTRMIYVPGALFSVNPVTALRVPNLFARNERVVCIFESPAHGTFAMVLVGATIVGSIATTWHGVVNPKRTNKPSDWTYPDHHICLKQGEEMGRFLLGSTIVVLFRPRGIAFNKEWAPPSDAGGGARGGVEDSPARHPSAHESRSASDRASGSGRRNGKCGDSPLCAASDGAPVGRGYPGRIGFHRRRLQRGPAAGRFCARTTRVVPKIHWTRTSEILLVMDYINGVAPLMETWCEPPGSTRRRSRKLGPTRYSTWS